MKRQAKNLKIVFTIEDNSYGTAVLLEHSVSVDSSDGFTTFNDSVRKAMGSINEGCAKIMNMHPAQIMLLFTEKAAATEARTDEAAKYKEGGDVWRVQNHNNELVTENACLKKQVKDLIEQLDRNISRGE